MLSDLKLMRFICEQGFCDESTRDKNWLAYGEQLFSGAEPLAEFERVKEVVRNFTRSHTKADLLALALEHGFLITPVTTVAEVVESQQFESRGYFQNVAHPELGESFRYPGPFAKFSATPIEYQRRPPTVGEHNSEVYRDELGLSENAIAEFARAGVI